MKQLINFIKTLFTGKPKKQDAGTTIPETRKPKAPASPPDSETKAKERPRPKPRKPRWTIERFQVEPQEGKTRFHDLKLTTGLMHAICDLNFKYCTDIQARLLPHTLEGRDATAKAQTGTGKSATFIIALINQFACKSVKRQKKYPRALILAPTRELVHQIEKDFKGLAKYSHLRIVPVFGGTDYQKQQTLLTDKPVDVIAATPGRLLDFISKKLIDLSRVEIVVIDEADRMLDMGFIPDVRRLIYMTPHKDKRQTLFFSATLTDDVLRLADSWTRDAVRIEIDPEQAAADSINQIVYLTTETDKFKNVCNLLISEKLERVIIFVNRKDTARFLSDKLSRYGMNAGVLSGDVAQDKRFKVLNRFKTGDLNVLVATDVAARGLHIENISHVINYDLPIEPEHYIHRIGRTGRAGATGTSVSFADEMSSFQIPKIEEVLGHKISCEYPTAALEADLPAPAPRPSKKPYKQKNNTKGANKGQKPYRRRKKPAKTTATKNP
ncbi:DEAD/DEAH box helicase [uncultured Desulfobacter sp.]|uniref:DEAD/DEAH box helicase n=1 Tax=uncultured Desulfobacter sp. TaxID=240139 RepID=UPI002AA8D356|nr:DEAD/DEAH box helicase [uncultured Desulfobacter sp.]